jgi:peptide/nickel transport system permease protein
MHGRARMILGRVAQAIPVVMGVVVISFLLTRALPGDPAAYFAGPAADAASIAEIRQALGLDKPLIQQFFIYVGDLMTGDLGTLAVHRPARGDGPGRPPFRHRWS